MIELWLLWRLYIQTDVSLYNFVNPYLHRNVILDRRQAVQFLGRLSDITESEVEQVLEPLSSEFTTEFPTRPYHLRLRLALSSICEYTPPPPAFRDELIFRFRKSQNCPYPGHVRASRISSYDVGYIGHVLPGKTLIHLVY
jgi:hypothetical protein